MRKAELNRILQQESNDSKELFVTINNVVDQIATPYLDEEEGLIAEHSLVLSDNKAVLTFNGKHITEIEDGYTLTLSRLKRLSKVKSDAVYALYLQGYAKEVNATGIVNGEEEPLTFDEGLRDYVYHNKANHPVPYIKGF